MLVSAAHKLYLVQSVIAGNKMGSNLPPGRYWLGDPCYILTSALYGEISQVLFPYPAPAAVDGVGRDVLLAVNLGKPAHDYPEVRQLLPDDYAWILDWRTAHGDGIYPASGSLIGGRHPLTVDSGGLALVDDRLIRKEPKYTDEHLARLGTFVSIIDNSYALTDGGDLTIPSHLRVITSGAAE